MSAASMNREQRMAALFESGKTYEEIGVEFAVSRQRVHQILGALGYSKHNGGARFLTAKRIQASAERRDEQYRQKYGMSFLQIRELRRNGVIAKFRRQRESAKKRGIEWRLTFQQWWELWQKSGRWNERGPGAGYCMARNGDVGPYSVENVYFCTISQNFKDSYVFRPASVRKKPVKVDDPVKKFIDAERRRHVAKLRARGLSIQKIQAELANPGIGCINKATGRPWGIATIHKDLRAIGQ